MPRQLRDIPITVFRVTLLILLIIVSFLFSQPNSRIVINEVMANPRGVTGAGFPEDRNEFVELFNTSQETVNVQGWRITDFDATDSIIAWFDTTLLVKYPNVVISSSLIPPNRYALILDPEYTIPNPSGGEMQPYYFPDSLIVLTIGNTTIGNELQTNDPLLLYAWEGDSSSFGTPFNSNDSFPYDLGDGISWERKSPELEDISTNWVGSFDSSGSTPGQPNSVLSYFDLAITSITNRPVIVTPNGSDTIFIAVKNNGYQPAFLWHLLAFDDKNKNGNEDAGERLLYTFGAGLSVAQETIISFVWDNITSGEHKIWAVVDYAQDIRLDNNRLAKIISTSSASSNFGLVKDIFSPDGNGIDDSLFIYYNFTEANGKLTLRIYDLNGKIIRKLVDKQTVSASGMIAWDGTNDQNQIAPIGIYIIGLEYKFSNKTVREKTSAVLAKKIN